MSDEIITVREQEEMDAAAAAQEVEETEEISADLKDDSEDEPDSREEDQESDDDREESNDESEEDEKEEDEEEARKKPKRKGGFQKRIGKLTRKLSDAEREAAYWREVALKKEAGEKEETPEPIETRQHEEVDDYSGRPNPDNFESEADWIDAVAEWKAERIVNQALSKRDQQAMEQQQAVKHQEKLQNFAQNLVEFKKTATDFDDLLTDVEDVVLNVTLDDLIVKSPKGPQVLYELIKDPERLEKVNGLTDLDQIKREIWRIEDRIETKPASKESKKRVTKAPPPPRPVGGKSEHSTHRSIYEASEMSQAEYEALRAQGKI